MTSTPCFQSGSLVSARGRVWLVLPESKDELLVVRPIDGTDDETTGILTSLEEVKPASFTLPNVEQIGDNRACSYLRDALRLSVRNGAGPFRSFGRIAVEPRPYQFVPLMLALKQPTVRLLIADDVGVGKTIEAGLIVRELLERGECKSFCVLCPPYLAEQWERELYEKFRIEAQLVLSDTVNRLEKQCRPGESLFEIYPYTIASIDFMKNDRRRRDFLRVAPDLIVVDEAHAISHDATSSARHQRYQLVENLCADSTRNVVMITATPHSGNEKAFRSLLGLLQPEFLTFPENLAGKENEKYRREIAKCFVQRRRADIRYFLEEETVFPQCEAKEEPWKLTSAYKKFLDKTVDYVLNVVEDQSGGEQVRRVRWWSALSLLRSIASSPSAARETLKNRCQALDASSTEEIEQIGRKFVLDVEVDDEANASDIPLGGYLSESDETLQASSPSQTRILSELRKEASELSADQDAKMLKLVDEIKSLRKDGFSPIVFCRFIPTVAYLCEQLRSRLPQYFEIAGVSGELPPEERERRILELGQAENRVLVCTDCLSEGINLQDSFDAVIHYDLSWNPTRHEQREGRVDRFGQSSKVVKTVTFYGEDNYVDGLILDVLIKKHRRIKSSLGVSVPAPSDLKEVAQAIINGLSIRKKKQNRSKRAPLFDVIEDYIYDQEMEEVNKLHQEWDNITEREKRSRTVFAQDGYANRISGMIKEEMGAVRSSIGSSEVVRSFVTDALTDLGASVVKRRNGEELELDLNGTPEILRDYLPEYDRWNVAFKLPVRDGVEYISRTHPLVDGIADYVVNTALDETEPNALAKRCGVIRTSDVKKRTTLLLLRYRFHLQNRRNRQTTSAMIAEDVQIVGFESSPKAPIWLKPSEIDAVLNSRPTENIDPSVARKAIQDVLDAYPTTLRDAIDDYARRRADELKEAHLRVRAVMSDSTNLETRAELPADVVGIYVYLP